MVSNLPKYAVLTHNHKLKRHILLNTGLVTGFRRKNLQELQIADKDTRNQPMYSAFFWKIPG